MMLHQLFVTKTVCKFLQAKRSDSLGKLEELEEFANQDFINV